MLDGLIIWSNADAMNSAKKKNANAMRSKNMPLGKYHF